MNGQYCCLYLSAWGCVNVCYPSGCPASVAFTGYGRFLGRLTGGIDKGCLSLMLGATLAEFTTVCVRRAARLVT